MCSQLGSSEGLRWTTRLPSYVLGLRRSVVNPAGYLILPVAIPPRDDLSPVPCLPIPICDGLLEAGGAARCEDEITVAIAF